MRKKAEIMVLLQDMMNNLHTQYHVRKIGIFGSYSKEKQTDKSDIDIVVEFDQPIGMMAFVHLRNLLSDRLGLEVDLVTPDGLHPLIRDQVLKEVVYV
jgi:predicted nucleotidyltransferase